MISGPAEGARHQVINGTQDGGNKQRAIEKSRSTLEDAIAAAKRSYGWKLVSVTPTRVKAIPLRKIVHTSVLVDAYLRPDVVSKRAYTVCWEGVFCTPFVLRAPKSANVSRAVNAIARPRQQATCDPCVSTANFIAHFG